MVEENRVNALQKFVRCFGLRKSWNRSYTELNCRCVRLGVTRKQGRFLLYVSLFIQIGAR